MLQARPLSILGLIFTLGHPSSMQGDVVYPGMPRALYPGVPVLYDDPAANFYQAQHCNTTCIATSYQAVPFHQPPYAPFPPPPYPYSMPPPPPAPTSSLAQALMNQYAPMSQRQRSFDSTDAAEISWQKQQQGSLVPPPPPLPAPLAAPQSVAMLPKLSSTTFSPRTVASLIGTADGMSSNNLSELPTFYLGQVLGDDKSNTTTSRLHGGLGHRQVITPSPFQHPGYPVDTKQKSGHLTAKIINIQRNTSCDTLFSEESPSQGAAPPRVQLCCPSAGPPPFESPFMPFAGTAVNCDHAGSGRVPSSGSEGEAEHQNVNDGSGGGGGDVTGSDGQMPSDPLEGMDMDLLFEHFKDDKDNSHEVASGADALGAGLGQSVRGGAAFVAGKQQNKRAPPAQEKHVQRQPGNNEAGRRGYGQNADLHNLFQSFKEDIDALPPLELEAVGKSAAAGGGGAGGGDDGNAVYTSRINRKRMMSEDLSSEPDTPERKRYNGKVIDEHGVLASQNGHQQRRERPRRVIVKKTYPGATTSKAGSRNQRRIPSYGLATVPPPEITAMLPSLQQPPNFLKMQNGDVEKNTDQGNGDDGSAASEEKEKDLSNAGNGSLPSNTNTHTPTPCSYLFGKSITASDAGKLARIVLPRAAVEEFLPRCESKNGLPVTLWGVDGTSFVVMLKFWMNGRPIAKRMWLLDQCQELIAALGLEPGKQLEFYKAPDGRLVVNAR